MVINLDLAEEGISAEYILSKGHNDFRVLVNLLKDKGCSDKSIARISEALCDETTARYFGGEVNQAFWKGCVDKALAKIGYIGELREAFRNNTYMDIRSRYTKIPLAQPTQITPRMSLEMKTPVVSKDAKATSAGLALEHITALRGLCMQYIENILANPYGDIHFGQTPNRYGLIIYDSTLKGDEKEMIQALASLRGSRGHKFEIVVIPSKDGRNLVQEWDITGDNVRIATGFLSDAYRSTGVDAQRAFTDEESQVVEVANVLKGQMPVGIIAGSRARVEDIAKRINQESRAGRDKYVFVTSQNPTDFQINGEVKEAFVAFEAMFADILDKFKHYDTIKERLDALTPTERLQLLFEILPAVTSEEFIQKIEVLKHAVDEIGKAA